MQVPPVGRRQIRESKPHGQYYVEIESKFKILAEGQGEKLKTTPKHQIPIPIWEETPKFPILDQGSAAKPSTPE